MAEQITVCRKRLRLRAKMVKKKMCNVQITSRKIFHSETLFYSLLNAPIEREIGQWGIMTSPIA